MVSMTALVAALSNTAAQTLPNDQLGLFPVSAALCNDMMARYVLHGGPPVGCDRLKLIRFEHLGFDGRLHTGEIMVMDAVANHVSQIFSRLFAKNFPIEKARLMNYYNGNDDRAIADGEVLNLLEKGVGCSLA